MSINLGPSARLTFRQLLRQLPLDPRLLPCVSFPPGSVFLEDHDEASYRRDEATDEPSNGGDERRDAHEIDFLRDARRRRNATLRHPPRVDAEADHDQQQAETYEQNAETAIAARLGHVRSVS